MKTYTQAELVAWGYEYDETSPYGIVRNFKTTGPKAAGHVYKGQHIAVCLPTLDRLPCSVVAWILTNGDIPAGHTVVCRDPMCGTLDNAELITLEEDKRRRKAVRAAAAAKPRKESTLPRGLTECRPGYYVASYMVKGKRVHKTGRDLESLTLWLVKERDGFVINHN